MAELLLWVIGALLLGFAAALVATLVAASIGLWLDLLDQLAARRRRRRPAPTTWPPCGAGEITLAQWEAARTTFAEGRTQRGNRSGGPTTPKPDIIPKPQFPSPRIIREDFLP